MPCLGLGRASCMRRGGLAPTSPGMPVRRDSTPPRQPLLVGRRQGAILSAFSSRKPSGGGEASRPPTTPPLLPEHPEEVVDRLVRKDTGLLPRLGCNPAALPGLPYTRRTSVITLQRPAASLASPPRRSVLSGVADGETRVCALIANSNHTSRVSVLQLAFWRGHHTARASGHQMRCPSVTLRCTPGPVRMCTSGLPQPSSDGLHLARARVEAIAARPP